MLVGRIWEIGGVFFSFLQILKVDFAKSFRIFADVLTLKCKVLSKLVSTLCGGMILLPKKFLPNTHKKEVKKFVGFFLKNFLVMLKLKSQISKIINLFIFFLVFSNERKSFVKPILVIWNCQKISFLTTLALNALPFNQFHVNSLKFPHCAP